jgi:hypothetical protein
MTPLEQLRDRVKAAKQGIAILESKLAVECDNDECDRLIKRIAERKRSLKNLELDLCMATPIKAGDVSHSELVRPVSKDAPEQFRHLVFTLVWCAVVLLYTPIGAVLFLCGYIAGNVGERRANRAKRT